MRRPRHVYSHFHPTMRRRDLRARGKGLGTIARNLLKYILPVARPALTRVAKKTALTTAKRFSQQVLNPNKKVNLRSLGKTAKRTALRQLKREGSQFITSRMVKQRKPVKRSKIKYKTVKL